MSTDQLEIDDAQASASSSSDQSGSSDSSQSSEAEKLEGLISDIDLSDVPQDQRALVKAKLAEKVKLYDAGFRSKTDDLSKERRFLDEQKAELTNLLALKKEIEGDPTLEKEITNLINRSRAGIKVQEKQVDKSLKALDQLIEQSNDSDQKEQLRQLRTIINEESGANALLEKLEQVTAELDSLKRATTVGMSSQIDSGMAQLEDKFGKELVDKYRADINAMAIRNPEYLSSSKFAKILYAVAETSEVEKALLESAKKSQQKEIARKENGSVPSGDGSVVSKVDKPRDKAGRVDIKRYLQNLSASGAFKRR